jgi:N-acetylneuraminic acid mutarotase
VASVNATTGQITSHAVGTATITVAMGSLTASVPLSVIANAWGSTGIMATGRANHTATLLANGKVLAAGGYADSGTEELYDPVTETWTPTGPLSIPVGKHTATLLQNGMVLVAGGFPGGDGTAIAAAELYDPATGKWSSTGSMINARANHTATLLPDGTVLVAGGAGSNFFDPDLFLASAEIYDPGTGVWKATGTLISSRYGHTATLLANGKVLVAGGVGEAPQAVDGSVLASAELYDPATSTWTATGNLAIAVVFQTARLLSNGKVLVAGGSPTGSTNDPATAAAELYDPSAGTWTATGSLLTGVFFHSATLFPDGTVMVAGGENTFGPAPIATAEIYDPSAGVWTTTGSLVSARYSHTATLLPNGTVLAAGGALSGTVPVVTASETYFPKVGP